MADAQLFTCLSCSIAFISPEEQRPSFLLFFFPSYPAFCHAGVHYKSDHHRYNMKRRVASLPPISVGVFNQKVLERRQETSVVSSLKGSNCEVCKYAGSSFYIFCSIHLCDSLAKRIQQRMHTVRIFNPRSTKRTRSRLQDPQMVRNRNFLHQLGTTQEHPLQQI